MVAYKVTYSKQALKDAKKLSSVSLDKKAKELIELIKNNPFQKAPPYEKLVGNLSGSYSRRVNIKHRIVYEIIEDEKLVRISRMWTHYGE
ncbi:Txe/YoeB family addiction module toxin [Sulfurimonas sp.]|uniref:Txe/YoeB family addiction module toxin n=1 Tax=Sulfurimonas sp. TaxID=2022749 RepID=UPI002AB2F64D|nr:Txe/YoeB family addiction module toxin [Sulfurimonas sp.]